jgi:hypothetical protein
MNLASNFGTCHLFFKAFGEIYFFVVENFTVFSAEFWLVCLSAQMVLNKIYNHCSQGRLDAKERARNNLPILGRLFRARS